MTIEQQMYTPITVSQQDVECDEQIQHLGSYICRDGDATKNVSKNCKSGICLPKVTSDMVVQQHQHMSVKLRLLSHL